MGNKKKSGIGSTIVMLVIILGCIGYYLYAYTTVFHQKEDLSQSQFVGTWEFVGEYLADIEYADPLQHLCDTNPRCYITITKIVLNNDGTCQLTEGRYAQGKYNIEREAKGTWTDNDDNTATLDCKTILGGDPTTLFLNGDMYSQSKTDFGLTADDTYFYYYYADIGIGQDEAYVLKKVS